MIIKKKSNIIFLEASQLRPEFQTLDKSNYLKTFN